MQICLLIMCQVALESYKLWERAPNLYTLSKRPPVLLEHLSLTVLPVPKWPAGNGVLTSLLTLASVRITVHLHSTLLSSLRLIKNDNELGEGQLVSS